MAEADLKKKTKNNDNLEEKVEDDDDEETEEPVPSKVEETEADTSLANSDVTTKYQEAAKICQATLLEIAAMVISKVYILSLFLDHFNFS